MSWGWARTVLKWFDAKYGATDRHIARWLFLRSLGLIYFSAFYCLLFQILGLVGPDGIFPAQGYLAAVARQLPAQRYWFAPTVLWISSGPHMLMALCWVGMVASILVVLNVWPRATLIVCFICFLSFIAAASRFADYQSDGMLLEAGFISLFFVPGGFWPKWGERSMPSRASLFLLQWEWFRIYFESGVVKLASGDPEWRHLTAMDQYYQNGPLPTWIGWYVQHLPHGFQTATVIATFALELGVVWLLFFPRRFRIVGFFISTAFQIGIILTGNYAFLNYIVLALGFLLLDDPFLAHFVPARWRPAPPAIPVEVEQRDGVADSLLRLNVSPPAPESFAQEDSPDESDAPLQRGGMHPARLWLRSLAVAVATVILAWILYAGTLPLIQMFWRGVPLPEWPVAAISPFRIANQYGLFAVMTRHRYQMEFQGSDDGKTWTAYPFRYAPQSIYAPPGIYAPYQPRFDWNLWFASLGTWTQYPIVPRTEVQLLRGSPAVLSLFAADPFHGEPPRQVRAVLWQYWFTTMKEKRETGQWWRREFLGTYAPTLQMEPDGRIAIVAEPTLQGPQQ
ncbi:MAG TPA: lipase maturation factor family protein [Acidobacteriaceae bacterium]|nr:lipase maturation factor family protein [Acidobacteriaceae bacterium]